MRGTLTIAVVLFVGLAAIASASSDVNISTGVTLTEQSSSTQIGSRIEAYEMISMLRHHIVGKTDKEVQPRCIGTWFSSTNLLPQLVQGLHYRAFLDLSGIEKVQEVYLTPDDGITVWPARIIEMKGWGTDLPDDLMAGSFGLKWMVKSRDKHNRIMVVVIPINWSSTRRSDMTCQLMVREKPLGSEFFTVEDWFKENDRLGGFSMVAAKAGSPPVCQQNQAQSTTAPKVEPQTSYPSPKIEVSEEVGEDPICALDSESESVFEPQEAPKPVTKTRPVKKAVVAKPTWVVGEATMVLSGNDLRKFPVSIGTYLETGNKLIFRRDGEFIAEAVVVSAGRGYLEAKIVKGGKVRSGDAISIKEGR